MMLPRRAADDPRNAPVWLRRQLLAGGIDDDALARMVRTGQLVRVRRGAYTDGVTWSVLDEAGRYGMRVRAVVANAKTAVVVSHVSGLPEIDAPLWGLDLSEVHLTRPDGRSGRAEAGVRQHCGVVVPDADVITVNELPMMRPARLALETTTTTAVEASLCVVNDVLHRQLATIEEMVALQESMTHWPNSLTTDLVMRLADHRVESVGESRTLFLCWRQGLPRPEPQVVIRDGSGREVYRVDFAWPRLGVFLEFDGKVKYEKLLRPGERASDVVVEEKRREEVICRLTGWRCVRITWADLARPDRTATMIRQALFPAAAA